MATKTCPSCAGHGRKNTSIAGDTRNTCDTCGGTGSVQDYSSGGGGGTGVRDCFPGDALVWTPGGAVRMDSVAVGQIVLGLDSSGCVVPTEVVRVVRHRRPHPILQVVSSQEELSFFATKRHPVRTLRGWVRVKGLRPGDKLSYVNEGGEVRCHEVLGVEATERSEPVFNLVVDGDNTFLVKGCVAHSFVYFRRLRTLLSWAKRLLLAGQTTGNSRPQPSSVH